MEAAKNKEIEALSKPMESKLTRVGELGVKVAEQINELDETKEDLAESKKFFADLDVNCENKKKEWSVYQKMQPSRSSRRTRLRRPPRSRMSSTRPRSPTVSTRPMRSSLLYKIGEECIAKAETYAERKARREAEINGLILSGAKFMIDAATDKLRS